MNEYECAVQFVNALYDICDRIHVNNIDDFIAGFIAGCNRIELPDTNMIKCILDINKERNKPIIMLLKAKKIIT